MSRLSVTVWAVVLGMLTVVYAVQRAELRRARSALQGAAPASAQPAVRAAARAASADSEERVRPEAAGRSEPGTGVVSGARSRKTSGMKRMETALKMMRNSPAFRRLLKSQMERQLERDYASLYRQLGLAEPAPLAELLRKKAGIRMEAEMEAAFGDLDREDQRRLRREAAAAERQVEQEIKDLLGEAGYQVYQEYLASVPERQQVAVFKEKLRSMDLDLSPSQEDALVALMHRARSAPLTLDEDPEVYALSTSLPEERNLKPEQMNLKRMEVFHQRYMDIAEEILTPEQQKVFEEYLNQWQDFWTSVAEYQPSPDVESHDRAETDVGRLGDVLASPVTVNAAVTEPQQWGDVPGGSSCSVHRTEGNMLGAQFDVNAGWGAGLTFFPEHTVKNSDSSANAAGARRLSVRLKAPAGVQLRLGLLESGVDWPQAQRFNGVSGADGEAFRHPGFTTVNGWQVYSIPLSELRLNGGYGNQRGNRVIDTQAIRGIEILLPGGQPSCRMEIDWVRLE
ncbi:MAG: hypothetical protein JXB04_00045 [Kiritimatiellae bacterium]|nr:hypothetical protein [Kiritimatiellia bacterium]